MGAELERIDTDTDASMLATFSTGGWSICLPLTIWWNIPDGDKSIYDTDRLDAFELNGIDGNGLNV